jgi:transcriptional regulator of arginine metabolism
MAMLWRMLIPELLTTGSYRTQSDLVRALETAGHAVNQATVSRELNALGVTKVEGVYRLPAPAHLGAPIHSFRSTANDCLCVVRTDPAFAQLVGQAIDDAGVDGVLGTVAGDDTVFVATDGAAAVQALKRLLGLRRPAEPALAR